MSIIIISIILLALCKSDILSQLFSNVLNKPAHGQKKLKWKQNKLRRGTTRKLFILSSLGFIYTHQRTALFCGLWPLP